MFRVPIYAIALLLCIDLHAQMMPFKNYGIKDGLNDNNVQAVIRDDRGILWVGTDFGIYWFDGKRFYQPQVKTGIGQLYVTGFYKDRSGAIWILTFFNGIYKYQNGRFTNYLVDTLLKNATTNSATDMIQVSRDKYVVISQDYSYLFDGQKFSIFDPANPVLTKTNGVTQLPDETILFSTDNGAFLYHYDHGKFVLTDHVLKDKQIAKTLVTKNQIWVLTSNGVLSFDNKDLGAFSNAGTNYLLKKKIQDITADKTGTIWAFTDNGTIWASTDTVFKIKAGKITRYTSGNGLPENIQQIYCDNEGLVWLANRRGISMLGDEYYEFNIIKNRSNDEPITSLATDNHNNFWIATVNGLVLKKDSGYRFYRELGGRLLGYIPWLHKNKNGSLWAGTNAGVLQMTGTSIKKQFDISATAIGENDKGCLWFGGLNGQVWTYDGRLLKQLKTDHAVAQMITAIHPENDYVWIGYRDKGVIKYRIKDDRILPLKEYSAATGYHDIRIRSFTADNKGNAIWGTRTNGVFIISTVTNNLVAHISAQNGLNANWVKDIYCDADGKLYLATNSGLNVIWGNYKFPFVKQLKINSDNINRETNCILKTGDLFYLGTNEGILKWIPGNIHKDSISPPVYFTQINIQGLKKFSINPYTINAGSISLPYDEHFISFEFAGISLKNPENVRYHYILTGQDNEWSPLTEHNDVAYDLKPGDYIFKVAAENTDGVWSLHPAVFHFIIKPPFWQTWWFIIMMAITILWAAYSLYRYKLSKALALELLRNKISADLHDDIGSTLSSISILSEVGAKGEGQTSKRILGEINERSHLLMEKMDDIVWSINSRNDSIGNLFIRIQQFASSVLEAKDIDYDVRVAERVKEMKLDMQSRQHIYLILKEAINNLIKYSGCKCVHITAGYTGGKLKIEVADDGKGFDLKKIHHGNGLLNMQKRADSIHAKLFIHALAGEGTHIILSVEIE